MKKLLLILIIGLFGCTEILVEETHEISLAESFKVNAYIESINDIAEADYYISLRVVEAEDEIDSFIRVDFNQLKQHGFPLPRKRFGLILRPDSFMYQVIETNLEFGSLRFEYEQKHTAVIKYIDYPYVYTDMGKLNYENFYEDRAFYAPIISIGDEFYPTLNDQNLRSINY